jgi:hypothetical protein
MAFTNLPLFPSTCSLWSGDFADSDYNLGHFTGAARVTGLRCELVSMIGRFPGAWTNPVPNNHYVNLYPNDSVPVLIYFPKGSDVRAWYNTVTGADSVKVDGTWSYVVNSVWPVACGFPGEFLAAYCIPAGF